MFDDSNPNMAVGVQMRKITDAHRADVSCVALSDHLALIATGAGTWLSASRRRRQRRRFETERRGTKLRLFFSTDRRSREVSPRTGRMDAK